MNLAIITGHVKIKFDNSYKTEEVLYNFYENNGNKILILICYISQNETIKLC